MKIRLSKRFVFRNLQYRLFTVLILGVSLFAVRCWQSFNAPTTGRFLVYLQPAPETIIQNRDLSNYDFGGRIASCFNNSEITPQTCESRLKQARNFILTNWKNKKRSYIILEFSAVDNFSEYYVFIEPANQEKWKIVWRREFFSYKRDFAKNISNDYATDVKRKLEDEDVFPFKRGYSILVFLDEDGKEIHNF